MQLPSTSCTNDGSGKTKAQHQELATGNTVGPIEMNTWTQ